MKIEAGFDVRASEGRLAEYFARIGATLGNKKRRECFAVYALGLLSGAERKSCEPIAARTCGDPSSADAAHQRLLHFVGQAEWDDRTVRRIAARHAIAAMQERAPVRCWIFDDTGFLKKGEHSVGVQRQYTGTAGKITNSQIGVSLSVSNEHAHVPIDFELYLPRCWTDDPARRRAARIPDDVVFKTKIELAIELFGRAVDEDFPGEIVLADSFYGDAVEFRDVVRVHGFDYAVGVSSSTLVRTEDSDESRSVRELALSLDDSAFRKVTWRHGTGAPLTGRFAFRRVRVSSKFEPNALVWLVIEWPDSHDEPTRYYLTTLGAQVSHRDIVSTIKERYRTEKVYEEMKTGLGLHHFEGRSFVGWHHHVTTALCCYAFIVAERLQHFPPSALGTDAASANEAAA